MAKKSAASELTTYYIRAFPRALQRQVAALALLRGIPVGEMLAVLVRDGLKKHTGRAA